MPLKNTGLGRVSISSSVLRCASSSSAWLLRKSSVISRAMRRARRVEVASEPTSPASSTLMASPPMSASQGISASAAVRKRSGGALNSSCHLRPPTSSGVVTRNAPAAAFIALVRRDVVDHHVLVALSRRAHRELRVARRMQARVGAHRLLVFVFQRTRYAPRIAERAHLACAVRGGQILEVALETDAVEVGLRLEQALQAEQDDAIVAQPGLDRVARFSRGRVEARARRVLDLNAERAPGEQRHQRADRENDPRGRLAQPLAQIGSAQMQATILPSPAGEGRIVA